MNTPGPNELELRAALAGQVEDGLVNLHISWGPQGEAMSREDKARYILDHVVNRDRSKDRPITASELDRQTLAPHVTPTTWVALTAVEKRREIDRGTQDRLAKLPPLPVLSPEEQIARLEAEVARQNAIISDYRSAAIVDVSMHHLHYRGVSQPAYRQAWEADQASERARIEALFPTHSDVRPQ